MLVLVLVLVLVLLLLVYERGILLKGNIAAIVSNVREGCTTANGVLGRTLLPV